ncbi:hypothetical protein CWO84_11225 [Methylomonas sp. Kb3]|nr:hypothetical protein CWO84_11225 [Methylomonas sp. Kb3]
MLNFLFRFSTRKNIKNFYLEDVMKKVLSLLAMTLMIAGLSGCMDDPDASKQKVSSSTSVAL